jgi:alkylation response protein AidB-like acyl-CoA dehydrogenase
VDFGLDAGSSEIQRRAREAAQRIVAPHARSADEEGIFRRDVIDSLAAEGFLAVPFPEKYGGAGAGALAMTLVYEEMGRVDSSVRGFLSVQVGLISQCLLDWGTAEQKDRWLPELLSGKLIGCYCLTEPGAGSDAAGMTTRAIRDGNGWILEGEKHWITNGNVADVALVFATVNPAKRAQGVTAFMFPTDTPGLHRSPMPGRELGHRGSDHAHIRLEHVVVGDDAVIGVVGEGFPVAMSALDHGRLGVAAGAVGILQACLDACADFARTRRQFGKRIGDFEMIQSVLADMAADTEAARLLVRRAAWLADQGRENTQAVSIAKLFATEAAARAADQAVLLHGARGYSNEFPVERFYRDVKGLQIYEGTSHIQRIVIARSLLGRDNDG